jgi:hypothetical protein
MTASGLAAAWLGPRNHCAGHSAVSRTIHPTIPHGRPVWIDKTKTSARVLEKGNRPKRYEPLRGVFQVGPRSCRRQTRRPLTGTNQLHPRSSSHRWPGWLPPEGKCYSSIYRNIRAVTGDGEYCAPAFSGTTTMKISERYRTKALACEKLGREVPNGDFKLAWQEIAIEWHALAARRAQEVSQDRELKN